MTDTPVLETINLSKSFGHLAAVDNVNLRIDKEDIVSLIGPNGAGKTTLFNLILRVINPDSGRVLYEGKDITREEPYRIAGMGIGRVYQIPNLFQELSVEENIRIASQRKSETFNLLRRVKDLKTVNEEVETLLGMIEMKTRRRVRASDLPHGEKKRVELALAVCSASNLLLLDEPTTGMNTAETIEMARLIKRISTGRTILLIEHDMKFVREISSRIVVMSKGKVIADGSVDDVSKNVDVITAYLGEEKI